jgi:hypothetical protein
MDHVERPDALPGNAAVSPIDTLIDRALAGTKGAALCEAYEACKRAMQTEAPSGAAPLAAAVFDVLQRPLAWGRALTMNERLTLTEIRNTFAHGAQGDTPCATTYPTIPSHPLGQNVPSVRTWGTHGPLS